MSNESDLLRQTKETLDGLAFTFRHSDDATQQLLDPQINGLTDKYNALQAKLFGAANLVTDADLTQMTEIRSEIDHAADTQALILGIARAAFFIGTKL